MNDHQIVELLFDRSESVLSNIDSLYGSICRHIAMNILNNQSDAEECVNDAYFKIWSSIPPLRPTSFKAYLLKTVKNLSLNQARYNSAERRAADITVSLDDMYQQYEESDLSTVGSAEYNEMEDVINSFLGTLDKTSRLLFVRRYWYGDSIEYLSEISGLSGKNVSQKLFGIKRKLKHKLETEGYKI